MTDEIIKALEYCGDENNCTKCPYRDKRFEPDISCAEEMMRSAAEQMKRLKAENYRLKHYPPKTINMDEKLKEAYKNAKVEAYKEFADRLKAKGMPVTGGKGFEGVYVMCSNLVIDTLLAELTHHKETVSMIDGHIEE